MRRIVILFFCAFSVLIFSGCIGQEDITSSYDESHANSQDDIYYTSSEPDIDDEFIYYPIDSIDLKLNKSILNTPYVRNNSPFVFLIEIGTSPFFNSRLIKNTIRDLELGEFIPYKGISKAFEWGYSFTHLDGSYDGAGRRINAGYDTPPSDRREALKAIEKFILRQYLSDGNAPRPWSSMNGHYMWHHYAAEFGFDIIGSEIGENINSYQMHIAFNRGAARQYGLPWFIDFSAWHGPSITDYSVGRAWGDYSGPDHGHSMSLLKRSYFMSFMSGANSVVAEGGGAISFYEQIDENGNYILSPYGEVGKEFYDFTRKNSDIGVTYTPFGIVLDFYHGVYPGFGQRRAFHHFPYNDGDNMTWNVMDLFFPTGWEVMGRKEEGTLVNGPFGDTCDVILQNAPQKVLNSYPVLILSGDISFSKEEIERYGDYVRQGGTLVLNSAYLDYFPEYKKDYNDKNVYEINEGSGTVVVYGPDYSTENLYSIIQNKHNELVPFTFSDDVQYIINISEDYIYLTLINNLGVTKDYRDPPVIDPLKKIDLKIEYIGKESIISAYDIYRDEPVILSNENIINLTIDPGELTVLKFERGVS